MISIKLTMDILFIYVCNIIIKTFFLNILHYVKYLFSNYFELRKKYYKHTVYR